MGEIMEHIQLGLVLLRVAAIAGERAPYALAAAKNCTSGGAKLHVMCC